MPTIYLKRRSTGEVLNEVTVGSTTDPQIPKVIDGLWALARLHGDADMWVDDSEVNVRKPRKPKDTPGDPKGWEAGVGSTEITSP